MWNGLNGERIADHFGFTAAATLSIARPGATAMVVTRLVGTAPVEVSTPQAPTEAAYSIMLQMQPLARHGLTLGGRLIHSAPVPASAVSALSLDDKPQSTIRGTFDGLQFYVPHAVFDEIAQEDGLPAPSGLLWPRADRDPIAAALGELILPALHKPDGARAMFVEQVSLAFLAHAAVRCGRVVLPGKMIPSRSGLAPWQERRAKEIMAADLATALTITEVARACKLSPSYFAAAFRRTVGRTPHQYLSDLRVQRAKGTGCARG